MPLAHVHVLKGHPKATLKELVSEVSKTYARITNAPIERVQAWITEVDPELYAIGGVPADELLAHGDRTQLEIPFVRFALMEGRPVSQVHAAIAAVTEVIGRVLGTDPERVRVHVVRIAPDHWGIGGIPASIKRKAELDARDAAS